jgi:hypothetical protein
METEASDTNHVFPSARWVARVVSARVLTLARVIALAALTDWLTAIGGVGAFLATGVLAILAYKQMDTLREQAGSARDQVAIMRAVAADDAAAVHEQIAASIAQSEAIREAVRAVIQPIVLAHATGPSKQGPDDYLMLSEGYIGFTYRLTNEGGGIALNIRHGIEVGGRDFEFGGGMETRALGPGQSMPPADSALGGFRPMVDPLGATHHDRIRREGDRRLVRAGGVPVVGGAA